MPDDTTIIRGEATLTFGDQLRFLARPYVKALSGYAAIMVLVFGAVWAATLPDEGWIALRSEPLGALVLFVADAWPFYLGTFAVLAFVMVARSYLMFLRYPHVNRRLSYEVTATGVMTRDAADFALMVPWASIIRTRNTRHALYLQTVARSWRHIVWRAFAPEDRDQVLRWATRERGEPPAKAPPVAG